MQKISYVMVENLSFMKFTTFKEYLISLKKFGYHGVEFNWSEPFPYDLNSVISFTQEIELPIVAFMTGINYVNEKLCFSSPDNNIRKKAINRIYNCIIDAKKCKCPIVIGLMQGLESDEPDQQKGEKRIEECLLEIINFAEQENVLIVIEPVNHLQCGFNNDLDKVMAVVNKINSPNLKPMLDAFHINIEEKSMTEPIFRLKDNIGHFHLAESNGYLPGTGHFNFFEILNALDSVDYKGAVSLKVYRNPSVQNARRGLDHILSVYS